MARCNWFCENLNLVHGENQLGQVGNCGNECDLVPEDRHGVRWPELLLMEGGCYTGGVYYSYDAIGLPTDTIDICMAECFPDGL